MTDLTKKRQNSKSNVKTNDGMLTKVRFRLLSVPCDLGMNTNRSKEERKRKNSDFS